MCEFPEAHTLPQLLHLSVRNLPSYFFLFGVYTQFGIVPGENPLKSRVGS